MVFFPLLVLSHFYVTPMPEFTGACICFPFQGMHLFSHFPSVSMSSYFLSCRDISLSLYLFLHLLLILSFLAGLLSCMSDWHHHLSPFPWIPSCSTNPFTTISVSSAWSPSLACCFTDSMAMCCFYLTCSSSNLLLQRPAVEAQDLSSCLLASNPPLHVEMCSWLCCFQFQICLFFFNFFISLSEHLLSHLKSQLHIYHHQHFPLLVSLCLIFFFSLT